MSDRKMYRLLVLLASFLQLIAPPIISLLGIPIGDPKSDPAITPAAYAFIIWGVITILSFIYGIYQSLPNRKNNDLHKKLSKSLASVYCLFCFWLLAASLNWLITTVVIFLVMFFLLSLVLEKVLEEKDKLTTTEMVILLGQVAIYTGWTTVAIFANLASTLKFYGIPDMGITGIVWQSIVLILALANSVFWLQRFRLNVVYGLTLLWAFVGVFFGLIKYEGMTLLKVIVLIAIGIIGFLLVRKPSALTDKL